MVVVRALTYTLRKNTNKSFLNSSGESEEKEDHNVYLKKKHWNFLDSLAEDRNVSRNQVLRDILSRVLEERLGVMESGV